MDPRDRPAAMIEAADLEAGAIATLRANDLGGWTKPAPRLYPHQWSWDSAFIAIGIAHYDTRRAADELRALFAAQWATGKPPQIVYNSAADPRGYLPDPDRWACRDRSPNAPATPRTSGICQPPIHALAALDQLRGGVFAEYYDPFTGEPLGSADQSWTAARSRSSATAAGPRAPSAGSGRIIG